jgi:hypothetical protein
MRVVCAWCQKEGRPALLSEDKSYNLPVESHGICEDHSVRLLRKIRGRLKQAWRVGPSEGALATRENISASSGSQAGSPLDRS